jgi:hypothetical protein
MSFAAQPVPHGATKIDYRANENKPYVHQNYPSCRYHPDGSMFLAKNEEQDKALVPPWRDTPYPPVVIPPPPSPPTVEEIVAAGEHAQKESASLKRENLDLKAENQKLRAENQKLKGDKSKAAKPDAA